MRQSTRPLLLTAAGVLLVILGLTGGVAADPAIDAYNKRDFATALRLWKAEAESGNHISALTVARMYRFGHGVPHDPTEEVQWYRVAADLGEASAMGAMAKAYQDGLGVKQDHVEAARWYLLAGERASGDAPLRLAETYAKGTGVPQDFVEAYKWYTIFASLILGRGEVSVAWNREVLAARDAMADAEMSPEQIAEAEKLAREWQPKR